MKLRNFIILWIFVVVAGYFLIFPILYHRINTLVQGFSPPPDYLHCQDGWHAHFAWDTDTWSCTRK